MELNSMRLHMYDMNEDELFYKKYYFAKQQKYSLEKFLSELDMDMVLKRHLLILEKEETLPPIFSDDFIFDTSDLNSIAVQKHNRFSPIFIHEHTFFEICYVYNGKCTQNISGNELHLHTGDFLIIPPYIKHSIAVFDEDSIIFNVMLREDTLHTIFYNFLNSNNVLSSFFLNHIYSKRANDYILFHTGTDEYIQYGFLLMWWESTNKERYYYQSISNTLSTTFFTLIRNYETAVQMPTFTKKEDVQRYALIQYIQENYKNICLDDIAEKFHFTPEYTSKLIKTSTGMTYTNLLKKIRMEKAYDMLSNTNISVAAIAEAIGFNTTEHFIRTFKSYNAMTPTEYRKTRHNL